MKKNIINRYWALILILGCFTMAEAQEQQTQPQQGPGIHIIPKSMKQNGNKLDIEMLFDMSNLDIRSQESRMYTPILSFGKKEYEMPKVIIKGGTRYKADHRAEKLDGVSPDVLRDQQRGYKTSAIYKTEKYNKNKFIPYRVSIPYRDWMADATMNLREEVTGCCGVPEGTTLYKGVYGKPVDNTDKDVNLKFRYLEPVREKEKHRYDIEKAYLDFPRGEYTIDPYFSNNSSELDKINRMIDRFATDPDVNITSIEIRGYASPESTQEFNYQLSSQRAQALRDYLARISRLSPSLFRTGIGGEDWNGLKLLLKTYSVAHKNEILSIINRVSNLDQREDMIKKVGGGQPYKKIFRDLYPKLRRVDCQINYTVRDFTLEEGKERILDRPKKLSQNEMYQVARSYPEGSRDFNKTLITAREYFPDNDIANLNGAAAALSEGDAELAEEYLYQVQNTKSPEYANCLGAYYLLVGNYDAAEKFLLKAQAGGVVEAKYNLAELERVRKQQKTTRRRTSLNPEEDEDDGVRIQRPVRQKRNDRQFESYEEEDDYK